MTPQDILKLRETLSRYDPDDDIGVALNGRTPGRKYILVLPEHLHQPMREALMIHADNPRIEIVTPQRLPELPDRNSMNTVIVDDFSLQYHQKSSIEMLRELSDYVPDKIDESVFDGPPYRVRHTAVKKTKTKQRASRKFRRASRKRNR